MAAANPLQVRQRLEAVLLASGLVKTLLWEQDCPIRDDQLPAFMVTSRGGERSDDSVDRRYTTRSYEVLVLFANMQSASKEKQRAALDTAQAQIDDLPEYLYQTAPRLDLTPPQVDDDGNPIPGALPVPKPLDGVERIGGIGDQDAQIIEWDKKAYTGVVYTIPVVTVRLKRRRM